MAYFTDGQSTDDSSDDGSTDADSTTTSWSSQTLTSRLRTSTTESGTSGSTTDFTATGSMADFLSTSSTTWNESQQVQQDQQDSGGGGSESGGFDVSQFAPPTGTFSGSRLGNTAEALGLQDGRDPATAMAEEFRQRNPEARNLRQELTKQMSRGNAWNSFVTAFRGGAEFTADNPAFSVQDTLSHFQKQQIAAQDPDIDDASQVSDQRVARQMQRGANRLAGASGSTIEGATGVLPGTNGINPTTNAPDSGAEKFVSGAVDVLAAEPAGAITGVWSGTNPRTGRTESEAVTGMEAFEGLTAPADVVGAGKAASTAGRVTARAAPTGAAKSMVHSTFDEIASFGSRQFNSKQVQEGMDWLYGSSQGASDEVSQQPDVASDELADLPPGANVGSEYLPRSVNERQSVDLDGQNAALDTVRNLDTSQLAGAETADLPGDIQDFRQQVQQGDIDATTSRFSDEVTELPGRHVNAPDQQGLDPDEGQQMDLRGKASGMFDGNTPIRTDAERWSEGWAPEWADNDRAAGSLFEEGPTPGDAELVDSDGTPVDLQTADGESVSEESTSLMEEWGVFDSGSTDDTARVDSDGTPVDAGGSEEFSDTTQSMFDEIRSGDSQADDAGFGLDEFSGSSTDDAGEAGSRYADYDGSDPDGDGAFGRHSDRTETAAKQSQDGRWRGTGDNFASRGSAVEEISERSGREAGEETVDQTVSSTGRETAEEGGERSAREAAEEAGEESGSRSWKERLGLSDDQDTMATRLIESIPGGKYTVGGATLAGLAGFGAIEMLGGGNKPPGGAQNGNQMPDQTGVGNGWYISKEKTYPKGGALFTVFDANNTPRGKAVVLAISPEGQGRIYMIKGDPKNPEMDQADNATATGLQLAMARAPDQANPGGGSQGGSNDSTTTEATRQ